ncbi:hypothetical protein [uncultured Shewanella sp.]|nr:hypothetical protein [uncultured Shewanella sp.]
MSHTQYDCNLGCPVEATLEVIEALQSWGVEYLNKRDSGRGND